MINKTQRLAFQGKSWQLLFAALILYGSSFAQGFPGTDSLRNYNTKYITNNPNTAFTNLRLHTLIRGLIDWVDTARAGTGGGGAIGVDTLFAVNDSTIRYRKSGVWRNLIIKGVADFRRKVDTLFKVNDTTIGYKINGSTRTFTYRGQPITKSLNDSTIVIGPDTLVIRGSGSDVTKVPIARIITINGVSQDLSADRTWTLTKADIGLSNVDNTSDANKPVSGPQQQRLNDSIAALRTAVNQIDVFLIGGQSNARGRGSAASSPNPRANTVFQYDAGVFSMVTDEVGNLPAGYGSMWPTFGIRYYNLTNQKICFVPSAVDGSAQTAVADIGTGNWSPTGTLYSASINKLNAALAAIRAAGYTPVIRGILWCQGETDVHAIEAATLTKAQYKSALQTMIANYRAAFDAQLPFFVWQTGYETGYTTASSAQIQDGQQEVVDADSLRTIMVSTNARTFFVRGLMSDGVHWNQTALNEQGLQGANKAGSGEYKNFSWVGDQLFYMKNVGIGVQMPSSKLHVVGSGSYAGLFENLDADAAFPIRARSQYQQALFNTTTTNGIAGLTLADKDNTSASNYNLMYYPQGKRLIHQLAPGSTGPGWKILTQINDAHIWDVLDVWTGRRQMGFLGAGVADDGVNAIQLQGSLWASDSVKSAKLVMAPVTYNTPLASAPSSPSNGMSYYNSVDNLFFDYIAGAWVARNSGGGGGGITGFTDGNGFDGTISGSNLSLTTQLTTGSIPFIGPSGALSQDNSNFNYDNTNKRQSIAAGTSPGARLHINSDALGGNAMLNSLNSSGIILSNTTAAANNSQQTSPYLVFRSNGWGTTAGTSQTNDWRLAAIQVQGPVPTSLFHIGFGNGGAYNSAASITSGGQFSIGSVIAGGSIAAGATTNILWTGRSIMTSPASGTIVMTDNANSGFTALNLGPATSSHISLQKSGTTLSLRNGDNTADATLTIGELLPRGGLSPKIQTITTNTTIDKTYHTVLIDATSGNVTVTLPSSSSCLTGSNGTVFVFVRIDNSGNTVTISRGGSDTINGSTSFTLTTQYQPKTIQAAGGTAWYIIQN